PISGAEHRDVEPWHGSTALIGLARPCGSGRAAPNRSVFATALERVDPAVCGSFRWASGGARGGRPSFGVPGRQWFGGNAGAGRVLECVSAVPCLCSSDERGRLDILGPFCL